MNQKRSVATVLLVGLVVLGGAFGYTVYVQQVTESDAIVPVQDDLDIFRSPPTKNNSPGTAESAQRLSEVPLPMICADFDEFKTQAFTALGTGSTRELKPNEKPPVPGLDIFRWKVGSTVADVVFPFIRFAKVAGPQKDENGAIINPLDNESIQAEMYSAIQVLQNNVNAMTTLGLTVDALNTFPLENSTWCGNGGCSNTWNRGYIQWGFTKGQSLYLLSLNATANSDAPGAIIVVAACASREASQF